MAAYIGLEFPGAVRLFKQGAFAEAKKALMGILAQSPNDKKTLIYAGYMALLVNRLKDAEEHLRKALDIMPRSRAVKNLLFDVYYRQNDFENASLILDLKKEAKTDGTGGGGKIKIIPFDIGSLSLGGVRENGLHGVYGPFPPSMEKGFGFTVDGLISHEFFRNHTVIFDFSDMMLHIKRGLI